MKFVRTSAYKIILLLLVISAFAKADDFDVDLANSLKIEANHNKNRLKSFKDEINNNKIFDNERESSLADFLEDQEKWELLRERGLLEYRREKRKNIIGENSTDYLEYLEEKESIEARYERSRQIHVRTRNQVLSSIDSSNTALLEAEELGINIGRPRYELRKRARNKWVSAGGRGGSTGSSSNYSPPPTDYSNPAPDYVPAPAPYEPVDESQFAPPMPYDTNMGMPYDGSMNNEISIPPPPPPPSDFDF